MAASLKYYPMRRREGSTYLQLKMRLPLSPISLNCRKLALIVDAQPIWDDVFMTDISIMQYKDAFSICLNDRMIIYGLTIQEAKDFRSMYYRRIPDGEFTPAIGARATGTVDQQHGRTKKRGRKLILERYRPTIEAYLDTSEKPTIKELDDILSKEGASYSSTASIKNMLHSIGREIPWKAPAHSRVGG